MTAPTPSVAIVAFSPIARDGRVLRQVQTLSRAYPVQVIGYGELPPIANARMHSLPESRLPANLRFGQKILRRLRSGQLLPYAQLLLGRLLPGPAYEGWYWQRPECRLAYEKLLQLRPDFIHANDWLTLPLAVQAAQKTGARVVADLHEYAPLELDGFIWHAFLRPLREYVLRRYMPATVASITVNQVIAEKYAQVFGFEPLVILNAPEQTPGIHFRPTDPQQIRLIHHGVAQPERKPELMIEMLAHLPAQYSLTFMLLGNPAYIGQLRQLAGQLAPGRVAFEDPVAPVQIVAKIAAYDIGVFLLPASSYNWHVALPNKLFEFINAGLAVLTGPSPEMVRLGQQHGFGIASPSLDPLQAAQTLQALPTTEIDRRKHNALRAGAHLNANQEMHKLTQLYQSLER